jgi:hypothetical protein
MKLRMLSAQETLAEIRRLYYGASRETIRQDLQRAVDLLKSLGTEEERERAAVYMDGLSEMRSDWARDEKRAAGRPRRRKRQSPK